MNSIIFGYIKKIIISNIILVFGILIALSGIVRLVDTLYKMTDQGYSVGEVFIYTFLSIPRDCELFFSVIAFLGGLLGLSVLEMHNEFIIMQLFGLSRLQILFSVIYISVVVLFFSFVINEWLLINSEKILCEYRNNSQYGVRLPFTKIRDLWLLNHNEFVHVAQIISSNELVGITLYRFNAEKRLQEIFFVKSAVFIDGVWLLFKVDILDVSIDIGFAKKHIHCFEWKSEITPYILSVILTHPNALSVVKLYDYIKYCDKVGQNSRYYQLIFWRKILFPISGLVMVILALSCVFFGILRYKTMGIRLLLGSIIGFLFYVINQIFGMLSLTSCIISPIIGSFLPSMIFLVISMIVIWRNT